MGRLCLQKLLTSSKNSVPKTSRRHSFKCMESHSYDGFNLSSFMHFNLHAKRWVSKSFCLAMKIGLLKKIPMTSNNLKRFKNSKHKIFPNAPMTHAVTIDSRWGTVNKKWCYKLVDNFENHGLAQFFNSFLIHCSSRHHFPDLWLEFFYCRSEAISYKASGCKKRIMTSDRASTILFAVICTFWEMCRSLSDSFS